METGDPIKVFVSYLKNDNSLSKAEEISILDDSTTVANLLSAVGKTFELSPGDYEVYHGLKCLDGRSEGDLAEFGIRSGSKLYAIQKKSPPPTIEPEEVDLSQVRAACYGLHTMFQDAHKRRRSKSAITKLFDDAEMMESIILSVNGLSEDQVALDILGSVKLFEVMVDPKNAKEVMKKHPCLAAAFVTIWQSLASRSTMPYSPYDTPPSTSTAQERMDTDSSFFSPPSNNVPSTSNRNRTNIITSSQLAEAISQAVSSTGAPSFSYPSFNTPTSSSVQSPRNPGSGSENRSESSTPQSGGASGGRENPSAPPLITPDVFSQAMQQALMSTGLQEVEQSLQSDSGATGGQAVTEDVMQEGLNQLRAMGITDDRASREALTATHGNVEAAVDLLFSGNE